MLFGHWSAFILVHRVSKNMEVIIKDIRYSIIATNVVIILVEQSDNGANFVFLVGYKKMPNFSKRRSNALRHPTRRTTKVNSNKEKTNKQ